VTTGHLAPLRVAMLLVGDGRFDARVQREALALAEAGHRVTLVLAAPAGTARIGPELVLSDVDVRTVALPDGLPLAIEWLWRPWRLRRRAWRSIRTSLRAGPRHWPAALGTAAIAGASLPWLGMRGAAQLVARAGHRPGSGVDWLLWWHFTIRRWGGRVAVELGSMDVWHGHDLPGLVAADAAAAASWRSGAAGGGRGETRGQPPMIARAPIRIYDSHEIYLESRSNVLRPAWARRIVSRTERSLVRRTVALVTVNDALAVELTRRLAPARVVVVHNAPPAWEAPSLSSQRLRSAARIPASAPIALYHGGFSAQRGLRQTAEALLEPGMDAVHLVFLGFGREREALEAMAAEGRFGGRLHVLPAVPPDDLLDWVSGADVEVMAIEPATLNHRLSTPNKLFESLAAGVPVVISDLPEMRRIVLDPSSGPLGAVCDPAHPASIATAIRSILEASPEAREALRSRCFAASRDRWNWERESAGLVALYREIDEQRWRSTVDSTP
jgi:glycosyltransferase involved in cell wall biosynthesis